MDLLNFIKKNILQISGIVLLLVALSGGGIMLVLSNKGNGNSAEGFGFSDVASAAESAVSRVVGDNARSPELVGQELAEMSYGNGNSVSESVGAGPFQPKEDESSKMQELTEMNNLGCSNMLLSDMNGMPEGALQVNGQNEEGFAPYGNGNNNGNTNGMQGFSNSDSVGANVEGAVTDSRQFPQFPQDQLKAIELLPKEQSQMFDDLYPAGQGSLSDRRDFLTSGHHIGVNTVGQSLRNASLDLRSEIPNPQQTASIWNQSTMGPDINRKQFEIGSA